jgi:hypothetical protein
MPATYTLISSNVLSSSAAYVEFTGIVSTYTDLLVKISARLTGGTTDCYYWFNSTTSNYSDTYLAGSSTSAFSGRNPGAPSSLWLGSVNGNDSTANTFTNTEIYIPSYTVSQNKPASVAIAQENNATGGNTVGVSASLSRNTAAITSIRLDSNGFNFASGSSFYLYGISNA